MPDQKAKWPKGVRVIVRGYKTEMRGVTTEKTSGGTTRIRFDTGETMLISNTIIYPEEG